MLASINENGVSNLAARYPNADILRLTESFPKNKSSLYTEATQVGDHLLKMTN